MQSISCAIVPGEDIDECRCCSGIAQKTFAMSRREILFDMLVVEGLQLVKFVGGQGTMGVAGERCQASTFLLPEVQLRLRHTIGEVQGNVVDGTASFPMGKMMALPFLDMSQVKVGEGRDRENR